MESGNKFSFLKKKMQDISHQRTNLKLWEPELERKRASQISAENKSCR